jgi:hypothetical protein
MNFSNLTLYCDATRLSLFLSKTDPASSYFSIIFLEYFYQLQCPLFSKIPNFLNRYHDHLF